MAQTQPVTPSEVKTCDTLPTEQEKALCLEAKAQDATGIEQAGDKATLAPTVVAEQAAESGTVVVTGSRISRSAFNSPDPLTVIDPALEQKAGKNDTAEILQTSPVAAGSFQITSLLSAGSFVTNGGVGAQTVSLRGLGAERTLVLVNGRRAGPAGTRGAIAGFDLNVIPSAAIQSVEILKTGASSIYGSDAIAGVVNLITRKSTDGLDVRAFSSVPFKAGGESYNVSATYGKQFSRGHLIGGVDYNHRNELERGDRDFFGCPEEFVTNPAGDRVDILDPRTGAPRCNAGFFNALNISTQTLSQPAGSSPITFGTIQFNGPTDRLGEFINPAPNTATFQLPAGFFPVSQNCFPTTASNPTPAQLLQCQRSIGLLDSGINQVRDTTISPKLDRYTVFLDGSFDVTDDVKLVGEFLYNKRKTHTDGVRQLFFSQFSGQTLGSTSTARPAAACTAAQRAASPNCDPTSTGDPLNAGFVGNFFLTPIAPVATFIETDVNYYRGVGGLQADLGGVFGDGLRGWKFDSYVQYSRSDGDYTNHRIFQDSVATQQFRSRRCLPGSADDGPAGCLHRYRLHRSAGVARRVHARGKCVPVRPGNRQHALQAGNC